MVLVSTSAAIFLAGPGQVGFLSDDYDLIQMASTSSWLHVKAHDFSPVMVSLLKATSAGWLGHGSWLFLTFSAHCCNIALVWFILLRRFKAPRLQAWTITLLFVLNAPGFEALAWATCVVYVLVTVWILLGVWLVLCPDLQRRKRTRWLLAALQALALLTWDWGILFAPIMLLCFTYSYTCSQAPPGIALLAGSACIGCEAKPRCQCAARRSLGTRESLRPAMGMCREGLALLWPTFFCWAILLLVKAVLGCSFGYSVALDPMRSAYYLLTAPVRSLFPNGVATFYRSPLGLGIAACVVLVLGGLSLVDRQVRLATCVFLLYQVPYVLLGMPESRYFYAGALFLFIVLVLGTERVRRSFGLGLAVILIGSHALWSVERAVLWKGAFREAQQIKSALEQAGGVPSDSPLVVVNLPDHYGPEGLIWRPYMWPPRAVGLPSPVDPGEHAGLGLYVARIGHTGHGAGRDRKEVSRPQDRGGRPARARCLAGVPRPPVGRCGAQLKQREHLLAGAVEGPI